MRRFWFGRCALAAAVFSLCGVWISGPLQAQGLKWQSYSGKRTATLIYGKPQTDNRQFRATCRRGKKLVTARMGYSAVKGWKNGRRVYFRYFSNRGSGRIKARTAGLYNTKEQIGGVEIKVSRGHGIWSALRRASSVKYNVNKRRRVKMGLKGSSAAINRFLKSCKRLSKGKSGGKKYVSRDPRAISCRHQKKIKSRGSLRPVRILFRNRTKETRSLLKLNRRGQWRDVTQLAPGRNTRRTTTVGRVWMLADGPGNCIELYRASSKKPRRFNITRPSPGFGPE